MRTRGDSTTRDGKGAVIHVHLLCVHPGTGQCFPDLTTERWGLPQFTDEESRAQGSEEPAGECSV